MKRIHFQCNRLIAALLALVCLLGLPPTAAFAASTPGTIKMDDCMGITQGGRLREILAGVEFP